MHRVDNTFYANDTTFFKNLAEHAHSKALKKIERWAQNGRIKINARKCQVILISRRACDSSNSWHFLAEEYADQDILVSTNDDFRIPNLSYPASTSYHPDIPDSDRANNVDLDSGRLSINVPELCLYWIMKRGTREPHRNMPLFMLL